MTQPPMPQAGVPTCYRHPGRESHIRCQRCDKSICPDCMRDAAVGFHCPDCVAEARKSTRQARTAYGGLRPTNASITTMVLIGINVAVWAAIQATGRFDSRLYQLLGLASEGRCTADGGFYRGATEAMCTQIGGARWVDGVVDGAYWQLVTSVFTHVEIWHIALNMISLYIMGPQLETVLGRTRYLAVYLLSGLAGSALVYWASGTQTVTAGASGAIFGLLGAYVVVTLKVGGSFQPLLPVLGLNAFITFTVPQISWQGHVGGFVGGVVVTAVLVYAPRGPRRTAFQVSGLVTVAALIALAIIARSAALA